MSIFVLQEIKEFYFCNAKIYKYGIFFSFNLAWIVPF